MRIGIVLGIEKRERVENPIQDVSNISQSNNHFSINQTKRNRKKLLGMNGNQREKRQRTKSKGKKLRSLKVY
jgi:hypothetical protein